MSRSAGTLPAAVLAGGLDAAALDLAPGDAPGQRERHLRIARERVGDPAGAHPGAADVRAAAVAGRDALALRAGLRRALVLRLVAEPVTIGVGLDVTCDEQLLGHVGRSARALAVDQRRLEAVGELAAAEA